MVIDGRGRDASKRCYNRVVLFRYLSLSRRRFLGAGAGDPNSAALSRCGRGERPWATMDKVTFQHQARQLTSSAIGRVIP